MFLIFSCTFQISFYHFNRNLRHGKFTVKANFPTKFSRQFSIFVCLSGVVS